MKWKFCMIKLIYLQFCSMELRVLKLKLKFPMVVFYVLHIFWNTLAKVLKIRSSLCGLLFFFGIFFFYLFFYFCARRSSVCFVDGVDVHKRIWANDWWLQVMGSWSWISTGDGYSGNMLTHESSIGNGCLSNGNNDFTRLSNGVTDPGICWLIDPVW